jgi:hypothetical protein
MSERVANLYWIIQDGVIRGRAAWGHTIDGTDEEKLRFLQEHAVEDFKTAFKWGVPEGWVYVKDGTTSPGMSWDTYCQQLSPLMGDSRWFEDIFQDLDMPQDPLVVVTCVVDGVVTVEGFKEIDSHGVL